MAGIWVSIEGIANNKYTQEELEGIFVDSWNISATEKDNVKAYIIENGDGSSYTLYIDGTGKMEDFEVTDEDNETTNAPWTYQYNETTGEKEEKYNITEVVIQEGVTNVGNCFLGNPLAYGDESITKVKLANSITSIGKFAFQCCTNLSNITIPSGVTTIGYAAFAYCTNLTTVYHYGNSAVTSYSWEAGVNLVNLSE